jgi:hypothetical protein
MAMVAGPREKRLARLFNEWKRRSILEPERFQEEQEAIRAFLDERFAGKEPSYGAACAVYLVQLDSEVPAP